MAAAAANTSSSASLKPFKTFFKKKTNKPSHRRNAAPTLIKPASNFQSSLRGAEPLSGSGSAFRAPEGPTQPGKSAAGIFKALAGRYDTAVSHRGYK